MNYAEGNKSLSDLQKQIVDLRGRMRKIRAAIEPQEVADYVFQTPRGEVTLSALFGKNLDLFVIHNMGKSCPYCTLWADGFNGLYVHLADRAAFVVSSPDAPDIQRAFAEGRGWRFPMISHQGFTFAADMGYRSKEGGFNPGVSVFQRRGNKIVRVSESPFGPGDDFCAQWHFLDLLPEGADGWAPKYKYG